MSGTSMMKTFEFNGKPLAFREHEGEWVVTAKDVAHGLGYKSVRSVSNLFHRYRSEFKGSEAGITNLVTPGGKQKTLCFSPRGAMRIALHASTDKAEEFRDFVLDVMEKLRTGEKALADPAKLVAKIADLEARLAESYRRHHDDLKATVTQLLENNAVMASALGSAMAHRRHQIAREKALQAELDIGQRFLPYGEDGTAGEIEDQDPPPPPPVNRINGHLS